MTFINTFVMDKDIIFEKPVLKMLIFANKDFRFITENESYFFNILANQYIELKFATGIKKIHFREADVSAESYISIIVEEWGN